MKYGYAIRIVLTILILAAAVCELYQAIHLNNLGTVSGSTIGILIGTGMVLLLWGVREIFGCVVNYPSKTKLTSNHNPQESKRDIESSPTPNLQSATEYGSPINNEKKVTEEVQNGASV